jgi:hypothetical protein
VLIVASAAQAGADITCELDVYSLVSAPASSTTLGPNTITATTLPQVTRVGSGFPVLDRSVFGHLGVYATSATGPTLPGLIQQSSTFANAALGNVFGETPRTRFRRLCAEEAIPRTVVREVLEFNAQSTWPQGMGAQGVTDVLTLLRDCEAVGGIVTDGLTPGLTFLPQTVNAAAGFVNPFTGQQFGQVFDTGSRYNLPASLTLDAALGHLNPDFQPVEDDQRKRNDWTVSRPSGSSGRVVDDTSSEGTTAIQRYPDQTSVNVALDSGLQSQAGWRVRLGTVRQMRYPAVSLNLRRNPELITSWTQCDVGSRMQLLNLPTQHAPGPLDLVIEGYTEFCDGQRWDVSINNSSYDPWRVQVIGDPILGRTDNVGSVLQAPCGSADATVKVSSPNGPWSTVGADTPWDIDLGGEQCTVTAVNPFAADTFTRTVSNGWGTDDTGQPWTTSGTASDYSVAAGVGVQSNGSVNVMRSATLDIGSPDFDFTTDLQLSISLASGAVADAWICGRYTDANNYYVARADLSTGGTMSLLLAKRVGGALTTLVSNVTVDANTSSTWWRIRFQGFGTNVAAKMWIPATATEPPYWLASATDTAGAPPAGTQIALLSRLEAGNTNTLPVTFSFDLLNTISPQAMTVTRSVNGVVKAHSANDTVGLWKPAGIAL